MDKDKVNKELLSRFWEWCEVDEEIQGGLYVISTFIKWLYDEGYEIKESK